MTAEIVSVGTELLLGQIVDTHAATMARVLAECGIGCQRRATVGDNLARLEGVLREALSRADLVITIGGLGPTGDDITRNGIANALGVGLVKVPEVEEKLRTYFAKRNYTWTESNAKQAEKPECAELIDNPNGTAPGLWCETDGKIVIALPGPKGEFEPMALGIVRDRLREKMGALVIHSRVLRVCGIGESMVEKMLGDLMDSEDPTLAPYAHLGEVHLRITTRATSVEEADGRIDAMDAKVREVLGENVFGVDEVNLETAVIRDLIERHETLSVAESMTGGALGARLTSVSGASDAFVGGAIVYTRGAKVALGVPHTVIDEHGPVSDETARALAFACRNRYGTDYAIAITGNAGPTSDIGGKPVGEVYIACANSHGVVSEHFQFGGTREDVRRHATQWALVQLRTRMMQSPR